VHLLFFNTCARATASRVKKNKITSAVMRDYFRPPNAASTIPDTLAIDRCAGAPHPRGACGKWRRRASASFRPQPESTSTPICLSTHLAGNLQPCRQVRWPRGSRHLRKHRPQYIRSGLMSQSVTPRRCFHTKQRNPSPSLFASPSPSSTSSSIFPPVVDTCPFPARSRAQATTLLLSTFLRSQLSSTAQGASGSAGRGAESFQDGHYSPCNRRFHERVLIRRLDWTEHLHSLDPMKPVSRVASFHIQCNCTYTRLQSLVIITLRDDAAPSCE